MLATERRARIVEIVRGAGSSTINGLVDALGVSPMTVRRDVDELAAEGILSKVRGGVTLPAQPTDLRQSIVARARDRFNEKQAIARAAAALVKPGMAIGLSGGSTAWLLAQELKAVAELTVITNSLPIADLFTPPMRSDEPYTQNVVVIGGVRTPSGSLVGPVAVRALEQLHLDIAFVSARGVDVHAGLTTGNLLEAETTRALSEAAAETVVLADHSKWRAVSLATIIDLSNADRIISDDKLTEEASVELGRHIKEVVLAPVQENAG